MEKFLNLNKKQWNVLFVGIPGAIGMGFLSWFYPILYNSLDKINQIYLAEVFAAVIAITIFIIRKKYKTKELEPYELLMIIFMGAIAGINLIPEPLLNPDVIITSSIIILVMWFVYFGLWKYLDEDKKIDSKTFFTMLTIFVSLTIIIVMAFNLHRIIQLLTPDPL